MASKIVSVDAGSPCARAGIEAGETLLKIDGAPSGTCSTSSFTAMTAG